MTATLQDDDDGAETPTARRMHAGGAARAIGVERVDAPAETTAPDHRTLRPLHPCPQRCRLQAPPPPHPQSALPAGVGCCSGLAGDELGLAREREAATVRLARSLDIAGRVPARRTTDSSRFAGHIARDIVGADGPGAASR